jgi:hypothetical protein
VSDSLSLAQILMIVRQEVLKSQVGPTKKITGPKGDKGDPGNAGPEGPQGKAGPMGKKGNMGLQGFSGNDGKDGQDGDDGKDGVGVASVSQDLDGDIVMHLDDGTSYTIELPDIEAGKTEVHYKQIGGGGSGSGDGGTGALDFDEIIDLLDPRYIKKDGDTGIKSLYWSKDQSLGTDGVDLFTLRPGAVDYVGAYTEDDHVATKKNVDDAILLIQPPDGFLGEAPLDGKRYIRRSGVWEALLPITDSAMPNTIVARDGNADSDFNQVNAVKGNFGGAEQLRPFSVYGTGTNGRLSLQGGSDNDNPGLEMTTDSNTTRVLQRLNRAGTTEQSYRFLHSKTAALGYTIPLSLVKVVSSS